MSVPAPTNVEVGDLGAACERWLGSDVLPGLGSLEIDGSVRNRWLHQANSAGYNLNRHDAKNQTSDTNTTRNL